MKTLFNIVLLCCIVQTSSAQYGGSLDPSFATGGRLTLSLNPGRDLAAGIEPLANGSFLVAGSTYNSTTGYDFFCIKVDSNGSVVTSFGNNGKITLDLQVGSVDVATSIAVDATGKFILAGLSDNGTKQYAALVRFNANGSIDSTFGTNGITLSDWTGVAAHKDQIEKVRIHALTGKIVVVGEDITSTTYQDPIIARYTANGVLDTTFAHTGVIDVIDNVSYAYYLRDLSISTNGTITAIGDNAGLSLIHGYAVRVKADGTLDPTFNTTGKLECNFNYVMASIYVDPGTGYIYAAGHGNNQGQFGVQQGIAVNRITPAGQEDGAWYNAGYAPLTGTGIDAQANSLGVFANGDFVLGGYAASATDLIAMMIKINGNTSYIDYSFTDTASHGRAQYTFGNTNTVINALTIQPNDQKVVAVGYVGNDLFVARFYGNASVTLDSFRLVSPANGSTLLVPDSVNLKWTKAPSVTGYELQYDIDPSFSNPVTVNTTVDTVTNNPVVSLNLAYSKTYYWRVRTTDGVNYSSYKGPWTFTTRPDPLSVNDINADIRNISIYPNPATSYFSLQNNSAAKIIFVEAFDGLGRRVEVKNINGQCDISSLSAGAYILRINTDMGTSMHSLIKK